MNKKQRIRWIVFRGLVATTDLLSYLVIRKRMGINITKSNIIAVFLTFLISCALAHVICGRRGKDILPLRILVLMFAEIYGVTMLTSAWGIQEGIAKPVMVALVLVLEGALQKFHFYQEEPDKKKRRYICLGFLIPALTMLAAYVMNGVYPFGDRGVLIIDSLHQYLPFFTDFHEKLASNESILYSFGGGLGYNMWACFAYYLASPLNLLIALVSMEHVMDFMAYLILLKISLSGGIFAWYLCGRRKQKQIFAVPFACMYALSAFMIGYYFNIMWLDSVMVVPIIMAGIEKIVNGKNGRVYGLALFYGLYCNYYIGFMLCLFSCLYFLVLWGAKKKRRFAAFFHSGLRFAWFSLLAGGMSAVLLMPAYLNLKITESADSSFPSRVKFYMNELAQLTGHFAFVEPINIYDDQSGVNIYCGVIVMILVILYLLDNRIRMAERVSKVALLALLGLSMNFNMLNYIWHGFHIQNGLPNRFAFLYIALLLTMGFDVLHHIRSFSTVRIAIAWAIPIGYVAYCMVTEAGEREWYIYIITLLLLVLYGIFLFLISGEIKTYLLFEKALILVMTLEMVATGIYGASSNGTIGRSSYVDEQKAYQAMLGRMEDSTEFFRTEIDSQRMRNENMFMGAKGLVLFSSVMPEATVNLCKSIGMEARTNKNGYVGVTRLFNDVFGIRYVVSKKESDVLYSMDRVDYEDPLYLYRNGNALSLGFVVSSDIKKWDINEGEAMEVQSAFATLASGVDFHYTLRESYSLEEGPTYIIRLHPGEQTYIEFTENVKSVTIKTPQGEHTYNNFTDNLFWLGTVMEEGENSKANITLTYKDGHTSPVPVRVYTCTEEEYASVYEKLAENQLERVTFSESTVSGKLTATKEGTLLLTVPYEDAWKICVDGAEVTSYPVGEALTGIDIKEGEHEIIMIYTPNGFHQGTAISVGCVLLYLVTCLLEGERNRRKKERKSEPVVI